MGTRMPSPGEESRDGAVVLLGQWGLLAKTLNKA